MLEFPASDLHNERATIPNAFPECEQNVQRSSGKHDIITKSNNIINEMIWNIIIDRFTKN